MFSSRCCSRFSVQYWAGGIFGRGAKQPDGAPYPNMDENGLRPVQPPILPEDGRPPAGPLVRFLLLFLSSHASSFSHFFSDIAFIFRLGAGNTGPRGAGERRPEPVSIPGPGAEDLAGKSSRRDGRAEISARLAAPGHGRSGNQFVHTRYLPLVVMPTTLRGLNGLVG